MQWKPFMDDVLALALALNKLGEGGLDMQRRSRTSKRSDAPQRDPTDARALGQFTLRTQTHSDICKERFVALLQVLQVFRANISQAPGSYPGFYKPVMLDDKLMHVTAAATSVARRETRRLYIRDLALPNFGLDGHIFKRGGPYPDVVHVWAVPSETPKNHEVCKHIHIYPVHPRPRAPAFAPCAVALAMLCFKRRPSTEIRHEVLGKLSAPLARTSHPAPARPLSDPGCAGGPRA